MPLIAALALAALFAPQKQDYRVVVAGAKYRVTVTGDSVQVAKKAMIAKRSPELRDQMRQAVTLATGCRIVDELPMLEARLEGKIACP